MKIFIHCRDLTLLLVAQGNNIAQPCGGVSGMIGHYFQMRIFYVIIISIILKI